MRYHLLLKDNGTLCEAGDPSKISPFTASELSGLSSDVIIRGSLTITGFPYHEISSIKEEGNAKWPNSTLLGYFHIVQLTTAVLKAKYL